MIYILLHFFSFQNQLSKSVREFMKLEIYVVIRWVFLKFRRSHFRFLLIHKAHLTICHFFCINRLFPNFRKVLRSDSWSVWFRNCQATMYSLWWTIGKNHQRCGAARREGSYGESRATKEVVLDRLPQSTRVYAILRCGFWRSSWCFQVSPFCSEVLTFPSALQLIYRRFLPSVMSEAASKDMCANVGSSKVFPALWGEKDCTSTASALCEFAKMPNG